MVILEAILGFIIGLTLGLLGGGGSILTVPALVYIIGLPTQVAITASLVIVGLNSLIGVGFHARQGTLNSKVAVVFGGVGMLTAYFAANVSQLFDEDLLMAMFAILMVVVGIMMIFRKPPQEHASHDDTPVQRNWGVIIAAGAVVGILTGFLGVGGGFLIVPALVMLVKIPIREAVGTSLLVIAMNSFAGFLGKLSGNVELDYVMLAIFVAAGIGGTFAGAQLVQRIRPARLQQSFAVFVIALGGYILFDTVTHALV